MANYQDSTGQTIQVGSPELNPSLIAGKTQVSSAINSSVLAPQSNIQLPNPPSQPDYGAILTGAPTTIEANNKTITGLPPLANPNAPGETTGTAATPSWLQSFLGSQPKPPSASDQYNADYNASGIDAKQADFNAKQQAVLDAQGELSGVNASLAGVKATSDANQLAIQKQYAGGTVGGVAPVSNAALRESALAAIPLQAQALVAQAKVASAQGNAMLSQSILKQAQDHLDTVFQIHQTDSTNQYNYQKDLVSAVFNYADKQQQAELDKIKTQQAQDFASQQNALNQAQALANTAITNGQGTIAAKILALDPKSPTYAKDVAAFAGQIAPKATQDIEFISATANQPAGTFNKKTGVFTPLAGGSGTPSSKETTQALQTSNDVQNILNSPAFDSTFGLLNYAKRSVPGTESYVLSSQINNLVQNLALAARGELKGQGAVSDFEGKMLKEAQTALKLNMTPDQARRELAKVNGALRTSSGLSATVKITDPRTKQTQVVTSTQEGINNAIKDGLTVEYQ
jgi:hypothetical protein